MPDRPTITIPSASRAAPAGGRPADPRIGRILLAGDVGGTSTKIAVVRVSAIGNGSVTGTLLATLRGPGANPRSAGSTDAVAAALADTTRGAIELSGVRGAQVTGGVLGMSGAGSAGRELLRALAGEAMGRAGITARVDVESDLCVALASGASDHQAPLTSGLLLLAGTGAVAARLADGEVVARCDGMGYLLGDTGSGVWIGREVARAAAADLDRRGPATTLTDLVVARATRAARDAGRPVPHLPDPRQNLIALIDPLAPAECGMFAPLIGDRAAQDDAVAQDIGRRAAEALLVTLAAIDDALHGERTPLVLAGSVLVNPGPVSRRVRDGLTGRSVRMATAPLDGAIRLALARA